MANAICKSLAEATRSGATAKVLLLNNSRDLVCSNLLCEKVGDPCICRLARVLERCQNLQELSLNRNRLTALPGSLELLTQLQKLDVSHNLLVQVPGFLSSMSSLQEVDFRVNPLQDPSSLQHLLPHVRLMTT